MRRPSRCFAPVVLAATACARAWAQAPPSGGLHVGLDLYVGASNAPGHRRLTDQFWAAESTFTPSVATLRWEGSPRRAARLAVGIGDASTAAAPTFRQPVEAWYQEPLGDGALTVGRFFTPFGAQEWQYEAHDGLMWTGAQGRTQLIAAVQKSPGSDRTHLYARLGASLPGDASVGLSVAAGRGFSYDSPHDRGIAVDATVPRGPWTLRGEVDAFSGPDGARFRFATGTLSCTVHPGVEPFVTGYRWSERGPVESLGSFRSAIVGVAWQATSVLGVEAATARAAGRSVTWLQLHVAWER